VSAKSRFLKEKLKFVVAEIVFLRQDKWQFFGVFSMKKIFN